MAEERTREKQRAQRMYEEGHCIGNHTYTHPALGKLSETEIKREFDRTERAINKALGFEYNIQYYRPPFGDPWFSSSSSKEVKKGSLRIPISNNDI